MARFAIDCVGDADTQCVGVGLVGEDGTHEIKRQGETTGRRDE